MDCLELRIPPLPQLITAGYSVWTPGMQHFKRNFQVYDLLYVKRGEFFITEEGTPYALRDGDMLILESGKTHWGHQPTMAATEIYWIHFSHPYAPVIKSNEEIPWSSLLPKGTDYDLTPSHQYMYLPKFTTIEPGLLVPVLNEMVELHNTLSLHNALRWNIAAAELFGRLQSVVMANLTTHAYRLSKRAVRYLQDHLSQSFDSQHMEKELHYHFDYISRCLKQYTGMSPLQYMHHLQIERAKTLLLTTDLSVGEIGSQVGQPNGNYFIRLFRKHCGYPPGTYRRMNQHRI